jgi:gluconokinase
MSMAASPPSSERFTGAAVVMGVASCGKTVVGEALARALGLPFVEGDRLHPPSNIAKMSAGTPLTDDDRWPWLGEIGLALRGESGIIASCSALKRSYREAIARAAGRPVTFIHLAGSRELLEQRIAERKGHFMPPSLLESQLRTLEPPAQDERALRLDINAPVAELVERARAYLLTEATSADTANRTAS